jgi:hypothetical protein
LRTASTGVEPPLEPLLEPFELGAFAFEPDDLGRDDFERDAFGCARFADFAAFGLALFGFAFDFDWGFDCVLFDWGLGFDFDCDFDFVDDPARFGADRFLDLVSAISLSPRGVSLLGQVPNPLTANHAECG